VVQKNIPSVWLDRKRAYQVFENLIVNALKYGCEGASPKIEIGCERNDGEICFYVRDHGQGIAKEYHAKIFGLFQRLETDNRGTGVGLTIVSRIMQMHGGRVWVDSERGKGAAFWFAFPRRTERVEQYEI
jgi:signal transduction histidine kinase